MSNEPAGSAAYSSPEFDPETAVTFQPVSVAGLIALASSNGLPTIAARQVGAKEQCLGRCPRQGRVS